MSNIARVVAEKNESIVRLTSRIHDLNSEIATAHIENNNLRERISFLEEKLREAGATIVGHVCREGIKFPNNRIVCRACGEDIPSDAAEFSKVQIYLTNRTAL